MIIPVISGNAFAGTQAHTYINIASRAAMQYGTSYEDYGKNDIFPISGVLQNFRIRLPSAPGGANGWNVYYRKNGADEAWFLAFIGAATYLEDLTNTITINPGDRVGIHAVRQGAPANIECYLAADFVSDDDPWGIVLGNPNVPPQAGGSFFALDAGLSRSNWGWGAASLLMPTAGTLKYFRPRLSSSQAFDVHFIIAVNGVDTDIEAVISAGNMSGSDLTHEVYVTTGDFVSVRVYPGGFATSGYIRWGIGFKPDVYGESVHGIQPAIACGNGTRWHFLNGYYCDTLSWTFPVTARQQILPNVVASKFLVRLNSASGQSRQFWVEDDGVDTTLYVQIVDPSQMEQDTAHTPQISAGSISNYKTIYASGGNTVARASLVLAGLGGPVDTYEARDIGYTDALGVGMLNDDTNIDQVGFEWGVISGVYPNNVVDGVGAHYAGEFALTLTPLLANQLYYYRAMAHHTVSGWLYGPERTFTTLPPYPEARTDPPSAADTSSIDAVGTIISTGGDPNCDKRGFVYGLTSKTNPGNVAPGASGYDAFSEESGAFGVGAFTIVLGSLTASKIYFVRAYCHNSSGYHYGSEIRALTSYVVNLLYPVSNFSAGIRFDTSPGGNYPNAPYSGTIAHYILCGDPDSSFTPGGIWGFLEGNFVYERNYFNDNMYTDLYNLSNPFRRTEGVVKVKWKARLLRNSYPFAEYRRELRTHGITYSTANLDIPYPYQGIAKICEIFYDNPNTTNPWTLTECDDLIAGVSLGHSGGFGIAACDQVDIYVLWANAEVHTDYGLIISAVQQRLVGTVNEDEAETCEVYFEWGPTVAYGNTTPPQVKEKGDTFEAIINAVGAQHFRAVIETECGETFYGADMVSSGGGPFGQIMD